MAISLKHQFVSSIADSTDSSLIQPSNWNEEHTLTLAANKLLGRASAGTGPAEEIDLTAAGRALLDDASAADQRTTLGLGTSDSPTFSGLIVSGGYSILGRYNTQSFAASNTNGGVAFSWNYTNGSAETDIVNLFEGAATSFNFYQKTGASTADLLYTMNATNHVFYTSNSERMRIDSNGFVGIGTNAPNAPLTLVGNNQFSLGLIARTSSADTGLFNHPVAILANTNSGAGNGLNIRYQIADTGGTLRSVGGIGAIATAKTAASVTGDLYFYVGASERMRIASNGNVAIGTSVTSNGKFLVLNDRAVNTFGFVLTNFNGASFENDFLLYFNGTEQLIGNYQNFPLAFITNSVERMRIDSSGNLSVGSTGGDFGRSWRGLFRQDQNDATQFGVVNNTVGASAAAYIVKVTGTAFSYLDWGLFDNNGSPFDSFSYGSGVQSVRWNFGGTERMRIDSSGNVVVNNDAVATTATDGFLYVPSCAGTPTGTPTTFTGRVPIVVDTTNNKLYFYSGGQWRDAGP